MGEHFLHLLQPTQCSPTPAQSWGTVWKRNKCKARGRKGHTAPRIAKDPRQNTRGLSYLVQLQQAQGPADIFWKDWKKEEDHIQCKEEDHTDCAFQYLSDARLRRENPSLKEKKFLDILRLGNLHFYKWNLKKKYNYCCFWPYCKSPTLLKNLRPVWKLDKM